MPIESLLTSIDWTALAKIIGIDIMLGVDNALVIALACATLPPAMRSRAILIGTAGAVILRALLLAGASLLMGLILVKLIAGAYLIFIGYTLLTDNADETAVEPASRVRDAVKTIVIADFMMSLDNVLGVSGAAQSAGAHSIYYAIAGIAISIPIIVYGATGIMRLMDRYPLTIWLGAGLLGWVGAEMIIGDPLLAGTIATNTQIAIQCGGFLLVIISAYLSIARRSNRQGQTA